ncbi:hypothetical protein BD626DRAFT_112177 [Schizophyllum amplum]|uniref:Uncharacterized protein n=1 Tax=Schizophyllum amplum TaxID=97359 RepID=A0A550CTQ5_9AGAR|nr:hypothetical protein BD626DRAFT_112177 [Auriculariopsis ampla]
MCFWRKIEERYQCGHVKRPDLKQVDCERSDCKVSAYHRGDAHNCRQTCNQTFTAANWVALTKATRCADCGGG